MKRVLSSLAIILLAASLRADSALVPLSMLHMPNFGRSINLLNTGFAAVSATELNKHLQENFFGWLLLPSLLGADGNRPCSQYVLVDPNDVTHPTTVAVVPVIRTLTSRILTSVTNNYSECTLSSGIFVARNLRENAADNLPQAMFIAFAAGNALLSSDLQGLTWAVEHLRANNLPKPDCVSLERNIAFFVRFDSKLLAEYLEKSPLVALFLSGAFENLLPLVTNSLKESAAIELSLEMLLANWSLVLYSPKNEKSAAPAPQLDALTSLPKGWHSFTVSPIPTDPQLIKTWETLANETQILGWRLFPALPELSAAIMEDVIDSRGSCIFEEKKTLRFARLEAVKLKPGRAKAVEEKIVKFLQIPSDNTVTLKPRLLPNKQLVFRYAVNPAAFAPKTPDIVTSVGRTLLEEAGMNNVELAVVEEKNGNSARLYIMHGAEGTIDSWLGEKLSAAADSTSSTRLGKANDGILAKGELNLMAIIRAATLNLKPLASLSEAMPLAGSGIKWEISNSENLQKMTVNFSTSEIVSFLALLNINRDKLNETFVQYILQKYQEKTDLFN